MVLLKYIEISKIFKIIQFFISKKYFYSAIATRKMRKENKLVRSFSIGINHNSPDIVAAREIATFLDTTHYEIYFTVEVR